MGAATTSTWMFSATSRDQARYRQVGVGLGPHGTGSEAGLAAGEENRISQPFLSLLPSALGRIPTLGTLHAVDFLRWVQGWLYTVNIWGCLGFPAWWSTMGVKTSPLFIPASEISSLLSSSSSFFSPERSPLRCCQSDVSGVHNDHVPPCSKPSLAWLLRSCGMNFLPWDTNISLP